MSGNSRPKQAEEEELADNVWRSKGRRALLHFIPFPLYYIDHFQMLSFLLSEGDNG